MIYLRNKGSIKPAPQLDGFAEQVSAEVQSWPGMISVTHWKLGDPTKVDGAEFHVEERGELGHIHTGGEVHIRLSESLRDRLVGQSLARPLIWDSAWVVTPVSSLQEADQATWLLKLAYDRLCSMPEETLVARIGLRSGERKR